MADEDEEVVFKNGERFKESAQNFLSHLQNTKKSEDDLANRVTMLLASRSLLTTDDRLYLYYFSTLFYKLMEGEFGNMSTESTKISWGCRLRRVVVVTAAVGVPCAVLILHQRRLMAGVLSLLLLPPALIYIRPSTHDSCYARVQCVSVVLQRLQAHCLPDACTAVADALLLLRPTPGGRRRPRTAFEHHLVELQRMIHRTLQCGLLVLGGSETGHLLTSKDEPQSQQGDDGQDARRIWQHAKVLRRTLESEISAFCRDLFMLMEQVQSGQIIPSPPHHHHNNSRVTNSNSSRVNGDQSGSDSVHSLLQLLDAAICPVQRRIPELESIMSVLMRQVALVKNWWCYPHDEDEINGSRSNTKNNKVNMVHKSEEEVASDTLRLNLQSCLQTLQDLAPALQSLQVPVADGGDAIKMAADSDKNSREYEELWTNIKKLRKKTEMCQSDFSVLEETVLYRNSKKKYLQSKDNIDERIVSCNVDIPKQIIHENTEGEQCVPYIAEDEVFEGDTEVETNAQENSNDNLRSADWLAELEQEECGRKKMHAHSQRVLIELQPILNKKKEEFQHRENIAKLRMLRKDAPNQVDCIHFTAGSLHQLLELKGDISVNSKSEMNQCDDEKSIRLCDEDIARDICSDDSPPNTGKIGNPSDNLYDQAIRIEPIIDGRSFNKSNEHVKVLVSTKQVVPVESSNHGTTEQCNISEVDNNTHSADILSTPANNSEHNNRTATKVSGYHKENCDNITGNQREKWDIINKQGELSLKTLNGINSLHHNNNTICTESKSLVYTLRDLNHSFNKSLENNKAPDPLISILGKTFENGHVYNEYPKNKFYIETGVSGKFVAETPNIYASNNFCSDTIDRVSQRETIVSEELESSSSEERTPLPDNMPPISTVVSEIFVSEPETGNAESSTSTWNLQEKPVTLQGRLQHMYQTHLSEQDEEQEELCTAAHQLGDINGAVQGLSFQSLLARQAVGMASRFGSNKAENVFGGVGECEETFGDDDSDEEMSGDDQHGHFQQTEL